MNEALTKSLLIIDDDIGIRDGLSLLMGRYFNVSTASSGIEALEKIKQKNYDIYLIDLYLGDISGFEVLKKIKESDKDSVTIILTAYGDETDIDRAEKLGAEEFLHKPISYNKLMEVIDKVIKKGEKSSDVEKYKKSISKFIKGVNRELNVHIDIIEGAANYLNEKYEDEVKGVSETIMLAVNEIKLRIKFLNILSNLKNNTYEDKKDKVFIKDVILMASKMLFKKNVLKKVAFEDFEVYFYRETLLNIFVVLLVILSHSEKSVLRVNKDSEKIIFTLLNLDFNVKSSLSGTDELEYPSIELNLLRELVFFARGKINIKSENRFTYLSVEINV
ncbi:MAG: two-component system, response regulator, stage 0 sporulation protein [Deferribacteres bacterium]|jgi:DNA-binding response OmpR family regulator|nr:two-component system, response regulator, stage 0 sporulation protein [Deferribacteres bacterium]